MSVRCRKFAEPCPSLVLEPLTALLVLAIMAVSQFAIAQERKQTEPGTKITGNAELVARGRYLVEGVAACADCHTPRDKNGDVDRARWLAGAPVFLEPAQAVPGWAIVAPRLAGLPPANDSAIVKLLTTGIWTNGKPPRQPMPRFHMTREDAEAVLAYLKSL